MTSSPAGARVFVNGVEQGVSPLEIRLARKVKGQVIRIESPGYNPAEIRLQRKMSLGPIVGNLLLAVVPGVVPAAMWALANDASPHYTTNSYLIWGLSTGAIGGILTVIDSVGNGYELRPTELTVTLTKADGTPRVDAIFVDPNDFQNIKWIRVHRD